MTAADLGPAPGLVNEWFTWQLVAAVVLAFSIYGAIWVTHEVLRIGAKWDADLPGLLDEPVPYRCRVSGHYFQAVPQMAGISHHVWKCATCGEFVKVGKTALYDQDEASA